MGRMLYSHHVDLNLVELKPIGSISIEEVLTYGHSLLDQGVMSHGTVEYVDMSETTNLAIDYRAAQRLVQMLRLWVAQGWAGSVFYAPLDPEFGMMRMVGGLADALAPDLGIPLITRREPSALQEVRALLDSPRSFTTT